MFVNATLLLTIIGVAISPLLGWFFNQTGSSRYFIYSFLLLPTVAASIWIVLLTYDSVISANLTLEAIQLSQATIFSLFLPFIVAMVIVFIVTYLKLMKIPLLVLFVPITLFAIQMLMVQSIGSYLNTFSVEKQDAVDWYLSTNYVTKSLVVPFVASIGTFVMFVLYMISARLREGKMGKVVQ